MTRTRIFFKRRFFLAFKILHWEMAVFFFRFGNYVFEYAYAVHILNWPVVQPTSFHCKVFVGQEERSADDPTPVHEV